MPPSPVLPRTMPFRVPAFVVVALVLLHPARAHAGAAAIPSGFSDQLIAGSLDTPVGIAEVPDAANAPARRILVVEQRTARVRLLNGGTVSTVGTVPGVSSAANERGLLGIAVDPRWPVRPYLYVHCTDGRSGNRIAISRFTVTGDLGYTGNGALQFDSASRYDLITRLPDNAVNHNGGTVRFGPDGDLYVSLGDDATGCGAQDKTQLVGKILRLDVSRLPAGPGGPAPTAILAPPDNPFIAQPDSNSQLVHTLGLRNPFRFDIDPQTGALFIGDVGEDTWEEYDQIPNAGMNAGWPRYEGPVTYTTCSGSSGTLTAPISTYDHNIGLVIIGGPVYRRTHTSPAEFPADYEGNCFFLDYYTGMMRRIQPSGGGWQIAPAANGQPDPTDWGMGFDSASDLIELADGSLAYCRQSINGASVTGEVRRVLYVAATAVGPPEPVRLALAPPRPSPSRGDVTLSWTQPAAGPVRLAIYDLAGRRMRTLADGARFETGAHELRWDGRDDAGRPAGPGLYFVRLVAGDSARQARVTLIR